MSRKKKRREAEKHAVSVLTVIWSRGVLFASSAYSSGRGKLSRRVVVQIRVYCLTPTRSENVLCTTVALASAQAMPAEGMARPAGEAGGRSGGQSYLS
eukprot:scaffold3256_cov114-Isochrysis_galbana.AAC.17